MKTKAQNTKRPRNPHLLQVEMTETLLNRVNAVAKRMRMSRRELVTEFINRELPKWEAAPTPAVGPV